LADGPLASGLRRHLIELKKFHEIRRRLERLRQPFGCLAAIAVAGSRGRQDRLIRHMLDRTIVVYARFRQVIDGLPDIFVLNPGFADDARRMFQGQASFSRSEKAPDKDPFMV